MKYLIGLIFLFISSFVWAQDVPKLKGHINDYANVLTTEQVNTLENKLKEIEKLPSKPQVAYLIIHTLNGEPILDYSQRVFDNWKLGDKNINNGLLVVIVVDDHKVRFHVGYGLEPYLTDSLTKDMQDNQMIPLFKQGNFAGAIGQNIYQISKVLNDPDTKDGLGVRTQQPTGSNFWMYTGILLLIFGGFIFFLRKKLKATKNDNPVCNGIEITRKPVYGEEATNRIYSKPSQGSTLNGFVTGLAVGSLTSHTSNSYPKSVRNNTYSDSSSSSSYSSYSSSSYDSGSSSSSSSSYDSGSSWSGDGGSSGGGGSDSSW